MEVAPVRQRGTRWLRVGLGALVVLWAIYAAITITGAMGDVEPLGTPVADLMYCAVLLGAGVLCLVRAVGGREERWVWATVGAGLTFWSFGDIWWIAFYANASDVPYPSSPTCSGWPRIRRWHMASGA